VRCKETLFEISWLVTEFAFVPPKMRQMSQSESHVSVSTICLVFYVSSRTILILRPHPLRLDAYSDFVNVFQGAINSLGGIDNLILAFTPPAISHDSDYIPGTDHTAIDDVMMPLMKCVKLGFYHWRRDQRVGATKKRLVILVQEGGRAVLIELISGHDADTMTSR